MADIKKSDVNERLWTHLASKINTTLAVNQAHPHATDSVNFNADPRGVSVPTELSSQPTWTEMLEAGRKIAKYFNSVTYALYGILGNSGAYNAYAYFYVNDYRHPTHIANVIAAIDAIAPLNERPGDPTKPRQLSLADVELYYDLMAGAVIAHAADEIPDLRVCHGSCHSSCHQSRGRR